MKTLVTGATGFIGTHLVKALLEKGRDIRCLVRKTSNTKKMENLGVELYYGDLMDKRSLENGVKGVNIIYHLAGEVYSARAGKFHRNNVEGTKNLLEVCYNNDIVKFIYLSSAAAVGQNPRRGSLVNEESPCHPTNIYGKSKRAAEKVLLEGFDIHKVPIVIIRPPIVYGPGQPPVLTRLFSTIQNGQFKIIGDGNNLKSFCYIDNLIQGLLLAEESEKSVGRTYFISDNDTYTMNKIAQAIAIEEGVVISKKRLPSFISSLSGYLLTILEKFFGIYSIFLFSLKILTVDHGCDISRAKEELGYYPSIDLQEGMKRTVAWCREKGVFRD